MGWCVYIVECESGAWYTGISTDVERRFREHQAGKGAKFMRLDKPKRLVAVQACGSRSAALQLEAALKSWAREAKADWISTHPYEAGSD